MNSQDVTTPPGQNPQGSRRTGPTRPQAPDTPELAERRAQAPTAQALIKATRRLFAEGGPEWATDKRIHETTAHPRGGRGVPLGTIRYYFGGREPLLVYVARYEHLNHLDRVRRVLRSVQSSEQLPEALGGLVEDLDHYQVIFGLLTEARQMQDLRTTQASIWDDWLSKLAEMVGELQGRRIVRGQHDPYALALLWSSVTAGLAAHRIGNPEISLTPALELVQLYAAALP
ncbi:MAG: TetR/AcrR family transcriptional regulator [Solirubrobacteraceae bacterium]